MSGYFGLIHRRSGPECPNHRSRVGSAPGKSTVSPLTPPPTLGRTGVPTTCSSKSTWTLGPKNPKVKEPTEEA